MSEIIYPIGWVDPTPAEVTARQAKSAMLLSGRFGASVEAVNTAVMAALTTLPEPSRSLGILAWTESLAFQRSFPLITALKTQLGLTDADIDGLFQLAATIE